MTIKGEKETPGIDGLLLFLIIFTFKYHVIQHFTDSFMNYISLEGVALVKRAF